MEETHLPDSFSIQDSIYDPRQRWWETIGDEQLNNFVDEALSDNQTLLSYWARFERAQAQARNRMRSQRLAGRLSSPRWQASQMHPIQRYKPEMMVQ